MREIEREKILRYTDDQYELMEKVDSGITQRISKLLSLFCWVESKKIREKVLYLFVLDSEEVKSLHD